MSIKKSKLLLSVFTLIFCVGVMCFGVYAATSVDYTLSGNITYEVSDVFVNIKTTLYMSNVDELTSQSNLINNIYEFDSDLRDGNINVAGTIQNTEYGTSGFQSYTPSGGFNLDEAYSNDLPIKYGHFVENDSAFAYYILVSIENTANNEIHAIIDIGDISSYNSFVHVNQSRVNINGLSTEYFVIGLALDDASVNINQGFKFKFIIENGSLPETTLTAANYSTIESPTNIMASVMTDGSYGQPIDITTQDIQITKALTPVKFQLPENVSGLTVNISMSGISSSESSILYVLGGEYVDYNIADNLLEESRGLMTYDPDDSDGLMLSSYLNNLSNNVSDCYVPLFQQFVQDYNPTFVIPEDGIVTFYFVPNSEQLVDENTVVNFSVRCVSAFMYTDEGEPTEFSNGKAIIEQTFNFDKTSSDFINSMIGGYSCKGASTVIKLSNLYAKNTLKIEVQPNKNDQNQLLFEGYLYTSIVPQNNFDQLIFSSWIGGLMSDGNAVGICSYSYNSYTPATLNIPKDMDECYLVLTLIQSSYVNGTMQDEVECTLELSISDKDYAVYSESDDGKLHLGAANSEFYGIIDLVVPAAYNGKPVTSVSIYDQNLKLLTLPENVISFRCGVGNEWESVTFESIESADACLNSYTISGTSGWSLQIKDGGQIRVKCSNLEDLTSTLLEKLVGFFKPTQIIDGYAVFIADGDVTIYSA